MCVKFVVLLITNLKGGAGGGDRRARLSIIEPKNIEKENAVCAVQHNEYI